MQGLVIDGYNGGHVEWFEGNFAEYGKDKKRKLAKDASQPHRVKCKKLA